MGQLFVVGDIHGCAVELESLLVGLPLTAGDSIVFLGDYVDRGPDSRPTIELLLALQRRTEITTVFLKGNHEDMLLAYLGRDGRYGEVFLQNGGIETLVSYGLRPTAGGAEVAAALPASHTRFLEGLVLSHVVSPYLMVHAGVDPRRSLADQRAEDLLWIRDRFIARRHPLPYTICFGHTPRREVLFDLPYKIGLDTGCVYGNRLSCIELREPRLFDVVAGTRTVRVRGLAHVLRL